MALRPREPSTWVVPLRVSAPRQGPGAAAPGGARQVRAGTGAQGCPRRAVAGAAARGGVSPRLAKRCWPAPFEGGGRGTIWPSRANARLMRRVGRVGRRGRCNACGRRWSRGVPRVDWSGIRRRPRWSPVRRRSGEGATQTPRATVWARRFAPGGKRWGQGVGNVSPAASAGATRDFRRELQSWHLHPRLRGHQRRAAPWRRRRARRQPERFAPWRLWQAAAGRLEPDALKGCAAGRGVGFLAQPGEVRRDTSGPSDLPASERWRGKEHVGEAGDPRRR